MYEITYSDKYERGLDIAKIAKRLRAEIKAAVAADQLPACRYSVRIERYSGGQSLNIIIRDYPHPIHNRRYWELEHEINDARGTDRFCRLMMEQEETPRLMPEAAELLKTLGRMADQWNYDGSETHIDFDSSQRHAEWQELQAELAA